MKLTIDTALDAETFQHFRRFTDWGVPTRSSAALALRNSCLTLVARRDQSVVGITRMVGDGVLNAYVQDMIVDPAFRGRGVGRALIAYITHHFANRPHTDGLHIGLMSAHGMDGFYTACGFRARPNAGEGAGFQASLSSLVSHHGNGH